jgi:DNA excision repair protein ERCC-2
MLDSVYETVREGKNGVLMIDAPTGSGKTSCISAALAAAPGRIAVAVRTVSQIDIYLDEINKIWSSTRHRPEIAYMVGKTKMCPLAEEFRGESVYAGCSRLRDWTKNYMTTLLKKSRDDIYNPSAKGGIPEEEPGYRTFCPHYLRSREAFDLRGKVYFRHSESLLNVVDRLMGEVFSPEKLQDVCEGICPYEVMSLHAKSSNLVILNYSHLFSPDFQDKIYEWLDLDPETLTLFIDEAHNLGDAVRALNTRILTPRMLDLAEREVERYKEALGQAKLQESRLEAQRRLEGIEVIGTLLPRLRKFMLNREARMQEGQALLDSDIFRTFLYAGIEDIDDALSRFSDVAVAVAETKMAEGDRENLQGDIQPSLALVVLFLNDIEKAEHDPSYQRKIVVTINNEKKWIRMEVNKMDPAPVIRRVVDNINATIMLSGTLSPLDAYELYCFGEEGRANKLALPNPFPTENRLLLAADGATSQLAKRDDVKNRQEIIVHIDTIIRSVDGNVAVFFTSYSMMNQYRESCKKGEALSGVAVVGLPLAVYDDIQKEINAYYIRKYGRQKGMLIAYTLPAINRGLQAAGRVIRDESEHGVILFCDSRFNQSRGGVRRHLPGWIQQEMIATNAKRSKEIIEEKQQEWFS